MEGALNKYIINYLGYRIIQKNRKFRVINGYRQNSITDNHFVGYFKSENDAKSFIEIMLINRPNFKWANYWNK